QYDRFLFLGLFVLSLIILICYASSWYGGYTVPAVCEMCFAIVFFCVFMMDLDKQFTAISWVWSDLIRAFTGTLVYLITSLVCVISGAGDGALIAGGVSSLVSCLLDDEVSAQSERNSWTKTPTTECDGSSNPPLPKFRQNSSSPVRADQVQWPH
uniref:Proteolipid protein 2 n=1 Tax=Xiphophorus couchianus TaxID=32473 RepID=A0A3B5LVW1_9TELE